MTSRVRGGALSLFRRNGNAVGANEGFEIRKKWVCICTHGFKIILRVNNTSVQRRHSQPRPNQSQTWRGKRLAWKGLAGAAPEGNLIGRIWQVILDTALAGLGLWVKTLAAVPAARCIQMRPSRGSSPGGARISKKI